jgi:N-acetylmuramoyl-L-alanine amidase
LYENTVVIDPVDDTGVSVIPYIKKYFDGNDRVRVFYTRQAKTDGTDADVDALVAEAEADFYIQVGEDISDDDQSGVRTYYNGRYFIRGFGNVQFADQLERNLAINNGANALGLFEADDDIERIMKSQIPSAYVSLGNSNNAVDADRMTQEDYLEKCAKGIADGIIASFDIVNPEEVQEEADPLQGIINGN